MAEPLEDEVATPAVVDESATSEEAVTQADPDVFSREYVEDLRKESAGYRTRAKNYEDVFEGYEDDQREAWLDLAKTFKNDPFAAADRMAEIAEQVRAARAQEASETGEEAETLSEKPMTRAEYDEIRKEERQQEALQANVRGIEQEAEGMGYTVGSRDYVNLLLTAQEETNGDLTKADEILKAERQKIVDDFLAQKAKDAEGSVTPLVGGGTASGEKQLKTFADAKAAAIQRAEIANAQQ